MHVGAGGLGYWQLEPLEVTRDKSSFPNSTTQHGNEHILCLPITKDYWPSVAAIIIFFATNYLAHAATVKSSPGDDTLLQTCNALLALCFPMSGLLRALNAFVRMPILARNELDKACRAGALCMVVRAPHWRPQIGQKLSVGVVLENDESVVVMDAEEQIGRSRSPSRVDLRLSRVHGAYDLPEGYEFAIVPRNTFLVSQVASNIRGDPRLSSEISAGYNILKAVASLIQVVAAFTTLLSNRLDLIRRWGPRDAMQVEDPAWSGLTKKDIQNFSITITSTTSTMYLLSMIIDLLDDILARKKKLSAKDAKIVHLEVVSQFNTSPTTPTPPTNDSEPNITQENLHVDQSGTGLPSSGKKKQGLQTFSPSTTLIQIPRAPQLSLGKGFLYTMHRVLEDQSSAEGNQNNHSLAMLQNVRENTKRLGSYRSSDLPNSMIYRAVVLFKFGMKLFLFPMKWDDSPELISIRSAIIYHPNCQRFLRWDDFTDPPKVNEEKSLVNQLKAPSPIAESGEANLAASISNVRSLLHLPERPLTSPASITELEGLLRQPAITRSSGRTSWAILVEISVGTCIVGLFFDLIAGLTKFHAGESSTTERGVMMAWLASGLYGFCLPLLSTMELLKVLFLFPVIISLCCLAGAPTFLHLDAENDRTLRDDAQINEATTSSWKKGLGKFSKACAKLMSEVSEFVAFNLSPPPPAAALIYAIAFVPLGIFIPPIWGFVLVGRMLTQWGDCVRLY
ncbi:hypothetical protein SBOR_7609 [Sclerotinia borealis F-4128]|uniref:Uncharacterized protein n=1 Tax=Sclerotinia borealis (strain F-4128) TaxID=1432307 RepID=W9CAV5_SCLBF|nr:hypothetical protein SBOR_7609 [Sclerotinia borealis F-4128]